MGAGMLKLSPGDRDTENTEKRGGKQMGKYFEELNTQYSGKKLNNDYEKIGNKLLAKYGLALEYGDHQIMVHVVSRPVFSEEECKAMKLDEITVRLGKDADRFTSEMRTCKYEAYACIMWIDPEEELIDNVHLEHYVMTSFENIRNKAEMTDAEYDQAVVIVKELLDAITE